MLSAAFVEQNFTIDEADRNLTICIHLDGLIKRDVVVTITTEDGTATGS